MMAGEGVSSTTILPAVLVLAHTFASQIIVTAALPLLVLIPLHLATKKGSITFSETLLLPVHSEICSTALRATFDCLFRRYLIAHFTLVRGSCPLSVEFIHLSILTFIRKGIYILKLFGGEVLRAYLLNGTAT